MADAVLTRRAMLRAIPSVAVVGAMIAVPPVVEAAQAASDTELIREHIEAIKVLLARMHPTAETPTAGYTVSERGSAVVMITALVQYIPFDGDGLYKIEQGRLQPIYRVERIYSEMDRTYGYRVAHWWKGKQERPWEYIAVDDLKIIRKIEGSNT